MSERDKDLDLGGGRIKPAHVLEAERAERHRREVADWERKHAEQAKRVQEELAIRKGRSAADPAAPKPATQEQGYECICNGTGIIWAREKSDPALTQPMPWVGATPFACGCGPGRCRSTLPAWQNAGTNWEQCL